MFLIQETWITMMPISESVIRIVMMVKILFKASEIFETQDKKPPEPGKNTILAAASTLIKCNYAYFNGDLNFPSRI
jgi:hypothetical protein